jgi:4-hydroxy-tetrahydrodipicolinate synthase
MSLNNYALWSALITPFTPGLKVDFPSLKALVKEQDEAGNGLLILGSTGEALNINLETRKSIVEFVISLKPKSPIMIGVGGHDLEAQMNWCRWLETLKIDAYLLCTPIYSKPGDHGQYEWFKILMDAISKPAMLYNVPGRAAKELSFKAVTMLKDHKNFWAIKEASGSVSKMSQYLTASGNGKVFCGDDGLLPEFTKAGACGLVSVASNTWPAETNLFVKKCLDNSITEIEMWNNAANSLFIASNPIPAKALLAHEGRINHDTMMPPLSRRDLTDLVALEISSKNVREWFKKNK